MIERDHPDLSIGQQCALLQVPRSSFYYAPQGETEKNLALMRLIDLRPADLDTPFFGVQQMKDVSIHDLRHTFASAAVASGQGLPMIGKLLGHTLVQTTARYTHLAAEPVRCAAVSVATSLRAALG